MGKARKRFMVKQTASVGYDSSQKNLLIYFYKIQKVKDFIEKLTRKSIY